MLLDMDALLDTRAGTLNALDPNILGKIGLENYRGRTMDDFESLSGGLVTNEAFIERYKKRDYDVLTKSIMTGILPIFDAYINTLSERLSKRIDLDSVSVDINFYPYVLPGPVIEMFKEIVASLLPSFTVVNSTNIALEQLTPDFIEGRYDGWTTYGFYDWMAIHHERLLAKPINGLSVITPRIFVRDPRGFEVDNDFFKEADKHSLFEMVMEDFVHIESIPVSDFSFVVPGSYKQV